MATIRVEKNKNYTQMAKYHLRDSRLSLRAKGLMSWMLSLPEDWDYSVAGLAKCCKEGREAVRKVIQELEDAGYLQREQARGGGRFAGYDYTLREQAQPPAPLPGKLGDGESPLPGKLGTGKLGTGKLGTGFPAQQIIKNKNNRTKTDPPYSPPAGDGRAEEPDTQTPSPPGGAGEAKDPRKARKRRGKLQCEHEPELFERFWLLYPRGEDKTGARYEWDTLKPDRALMQEMSAALHRLNESDEQWQRGVGVPWASRWLRERRWEWMADMEAKSQPRKASGSDTGGWIDAPEVS